MHENYFIPGETLLHKKSNYTVVYLGDVVAGQEHISFGKFTEKIIRMDLEEYRPTPLFGFNFLDDKGKVRRFYQEKEDMDQFLGKGDVLFFILKKAKRISYGIFNSNRMDDFLETWNEVEEYNESLLSSSDAWTPPLRNDEEFIKLYFIPVSEEEINLMREAVLPF